MIDIAALAGIAALIVVGVFFWKRFGIGSGRGFGNRVASHVGIPKGVFYLLLDNGVKGSTHDLLVSLQEADFDLDQAAVELGPTLARGIERLEERFGTQGVYEKVKPTIAKLVSEFERKQ